jgi:hypothetical protein
METCKVLVKEDDCATIICPCCSKTKKISAGPYRQNSRRNLRVKCSCDEVFWLSLEYRRDYRKLVKLLGKSVNLSNHRESQDIIIRNISKGGVGFCPFTQHKTRPDDRLLVSFELNDCNCTPIETDVTVRTVSDVYIGCEFNNTHNIEKSLGFYLLL